MEGREVGAREGLDQLCNSVWKRANLLLDDNPQLFRHCFPWHLQPVEILNILDIKKSPQHQMQRVLKFLPDQIFVYKEGCLITKYDNTAPKDMIFEPTWTQLLLLQAPLYDFPKLEQLTLYPGESRLVAALNLQEDLLH